MEIKKGIVIDGVLHEVIRTFEFSCEGCSLSELCDNGLLQTNFCLGPGRVFVKRGKVKIEENERD